MAITVVTPASGSTPLAALTGNTAETGAEGSGFSALFGQVLADKKGKAGASDLLGGGLTDPALQLAGLSGDADSLMAGVLPPEIQALLNGKLARQGKGGDKQASDTEALIAPLQAQIEARTKGILNNNRQDLGSLSQLAQSRAQLEDVTLTTHGAANLAASTLADAETFTQTLHSLPGTTQSSSQTQQAQSALPEMRTPLHDTSRWSQEFGEKIVWMAKNDLQQAQLNLNPAHLGPLRITLNMEADQASAVFTAATPEVRQVIEDAMPRLREMLAGAGISLGHTQVGTQSQQEQAMAQEGRGSSQANKDGAILEAESAAATPVIQRRGSGMVDLFA